MNKWNYPFFLLLWLSRQHQPFPQIHLIGIKYIYQRRRQAWLKNIPAKLYSFFYTILGPIKKVFTAWSMTAQEL